MMMKTKRALVVVAALALNACAHRPSSTHAIQQQCRLEMEAARTAIHLRDEGKSKQDMLQTLPSLQPDSTRLLRQMYHIVDETYAAPGLNDIVYGIYRFEYCARQLQYQSAPLQFKTIVTQLQACQAQYGRQASQQAISCIRAAFPKQAYAQPTPDTTKDVYK
jgi:hypothetical protein